MYGSGVQTESKLRKSVLAESKLTEEWASFQREGKWKAVGGEGKGRKGGIIFLPPPPPSP